MENNLDIEFPEALEFLFAPARYKVPYGGRGSGKSYSVAEALVLITNMVTIKVLCFREVQDSIKQSVHSILKRQIKERGLSRRFQVLETEIRNKYTGSVFIFAGLSNLTEDNLKSLDDVDIAWGEEAKTLSKSSLAVLRPTIRKDNTNIYDWHPEYKYKKWSSEIWLTFNPELETDPVYDEFVTKTPTDCIAKLVNFNHNPFFPKILEQERLDCLRDDPKNYPNIWEGKCKPAVEGAIYYEEIVKAQDESRITNVPYDPLLKVHCVWDLGWNDAMCITFVQKSASALHIIDYIEGNRRTYDDYMIEINAKKYNLGTHFLPHDGFSHDPKSGKTVQQILQALGATVQQVPNLDVESGIQSARMAFRRLYFDKTKASRLIECLKRYRRNINQSTLEFTTPRHDEFSHGADSFRYVCVCADQFSNDEYGGKLNYPSLGKF